MKRQMPFAIGIMLIAVQVSGQHILFSDDFDSGLDSAWEMPAGGWSTEGGCLHSLPDSPENAPLYAGGEDQYNYQIAYRFRVMYYEQAWAGFYLYMSDPVSPNDGNTDCYAFIYIRDRRPGEVWGGFKIYRYLDGAPHLLGTMSTFDTWDDQYVKFGRVDNRMCIKHWREGVPEPYWQMAFAVERIQSGYWMPVVYHAWIDDLQIEGYGAVPTEQTSWGNVKALYR